MGKMHIHGGGRKVTNEGCARRSDAWLRGKHGVAIVEEVQAAVHGQDEARVRVG
ncbi:hypothetical protein SESBI_33095 [Sesbania bispinosa]|nr:hypothetical protein SESBI_33091 [Sesbania bispinosa]KAJ1395749.1 hypothetical protein SESBI_33093 [Sesbania bispinosa]KAJ1395751.1 hypothetical protein SESBI_33095 [Sesbania bispinosa]